MESRRKRANAIRFLSMDAVQEANSGHPGAPMGLADIAEVLWNDFLRHNPVDPAWPDRDRFILSNGHGSMLLYSLLHLSGYALSLQDLKDFRQLHSRTPGHPEYGLTPGVETTTGPLGQGLANAVGMALGERLLADRFNRKGHRIVDHATYVVLGDGCLMEGISHEAASLAGTLGLGKLTAIYDDNGISIDGLVRDWFAEDRAKRFEAYGWHVIPRINGHDPEAVHDALEEARAVTDRPSLLCCQTTIGFGAPHMAGSHKTHGAPLGKDEIQAAREHLDWRFEPFVIPGEIYKGWDAREKGQSLQQEWEAGFSKYQQAFPGLAAEFLRVSTGTLPREFTEKAEQAIFKLAEKGESLATRKASKKALEAMGPLLPELIGGSSDLSGSNQTEWSGSRALVPGNLSGNYIHYGVREFAMAAIMNGLALHKGLIPYGGTFLVFSDYSRNAIRLAALMGIRSIFVLTHDSIGVGEDGPTHQPVEHISSLRLIPNLNVWRPCDSVECGMAWKASLEEASTPSALILTRQTTRHQERTVQGINNIQRGGYVLLEAEANLEAIIIATGSEVEPAVEAAADLNNRGRGVRVVSMPCLEIFETQSREYQEEVLPRAVAARVVVEAGVSAPWYKYAGSEGRVLGIDRFGESAPGKELFTYFGLTTEQIQNAVEEVLGEK
ncbi:MAG: transketolase [Thermodesulfobacteriota bacterium]